MPKPITHNEIKTNNNGKKSQKQIDYLRQRAEELVDVHASWRAFFLGKQNAREHAGFFEEELKAIKQQVDEDKQAYIDRKKRKTNPAPYLHRRAKQLAIVDSSWSCYFFGEAKARADAGFGLDEILYIERQRRMDYENALNNPDNLRKRAKVLAEVDNTWSAFLNGKDYARSQAGFKFSEVRAIEKQLERDRVIATAQRNTHSFFSSAYSYFFAPDPEKERQERRERLNDLREKHEKRKEEEALRKRLPGPN